MDLNLIRLEFKWERERRDDGERDGDELVNKKKKRRNTERKKKKK